MEYYSEHGFLEELLALRSDPWGGTLPLEMLNHEFQSINGWSNSNIDYFGGNPFPISETSCFENFNLPSNQGLNCSFVSHDQFYTPYTGDNQLSPPDQFTDNSSISKLDTPPFPASQEDLSVMDDADFGLVGNCLQNLDQTGCRLITPCKMEPVHSAEAPSFNMGACPERKNKVKKIDGQPSKNLMAERRRRKRLNDRLSMLRSIVPKISKMDRTSILGDTIDYMKELLERINNLQEEIEVGPNQMSMMSIFKDVKPNEVLIRNSPKFDVERRNSDTRIEICCAGKPGLLLSTVTTLEALGLEIQQCVISCFNDFAIQASCLEDLDRRAILNAEEIKQELFRNAGYGGRCL